MEHSPVLGATAHRESWEGGPGFWGPHDDLRSRHRRIGIPSRSTGVCWVCVTPSTVPLEKEGKNKTETGGGTTWGKPAPSRGFSHRETSTHLTPTGWRGNGRVERAESRAGPPLSGTVSQQKNEQALILLRHGWNLQTVHWPKKPDPRGQSRTSPFIAKWSGQASGWRQSGCLDLGAGEIRVNAEECRVSLQDDEHVLKSTSVLVAQLCEYTKNHWIAHFRWVSCVVCGVYCP